MTKPVKRLVAKLSNGSTLTGRIEEENLKYLALVDMEDVTINRRGEEPVVKKTLKLNLIQVLYYELEDMGEE